MNKFLGNALDEAVKVLALLGPWGVFGCITCSSVNFACYANYTMRC